LGFGFASSSFVGLSSGFGFGGAACLLFGFAPGLGFGFASSSFVGLSSGFGFAPGLGFGFASGLRLRFAARLHGLSACLGRRFAAGLLLGKPCPRLRFVGVDRVALRQRLPLLRQSHLPVFALPLEHVSDRTSDTAI
jgi:hypothetical protein